VLALDYGTARCGCAISDPTGTLARPLDAIEPPDPAAVAELVSREGAERVIVGLPTTLGGEEGEQARLSREIAEQLAELLDVPVETYDERLTTRMADRSAREGARADRDSPRRPICWRATSRGEREIDGGPRRLARRHRGNLARPVATE
jgi:putative Holliday junction resolvase